MKKIIFSLIGFSFFGSVFAQEAFDKKMQFGIVLGTGFNTNKTSTLLDRSGIGFDQTLGLNLNYNINSTLTLTTGLEFDFESFKYTPKDSVFYYFMDNEIKNKEEVGDGVLDPNIELFKLEKRQYKVNYLTIPVFVTLKTKPFGNLQYFGKFGSRISARMGGKINDEGYLYAGNVLSGTKTEAENTNMTLKNDVRLFKINAGISGGAMWNFSGSTMLVGEIGYFFGLTQIHFDEKLTGDDKKRDFTLIEYEAAKGNTLTPNQRKFVAPDAKQGQILIKMTLFF